MVQFPIKFGSDWNHAENTPMKNQPTLTPAGCRDRRNQLRRKLRDLDLDAALLTDRRHVHYFTGYWHYSSHTAVALLLPLSGKPVLVTPNAPRAIDGLESLGYEAARFCTLVDDPKGNALSALAPHVKPLRRIGCDDVLRPWLLPRPRLVDLNPTLMQLRRTKAADEVALLRHAVAACDAAYAAARRLLKPGLTEVRLFAALQAAAVEAAGEPIGEFGNDFQSGSPGGPPRDRRVAGGEIAIYDLTAIYRGYACDVCRSFAVDGRPTAAQRAAQRRIAAFLRYIEKTVRPGVSCRGLFEEARDWLHGYRGWQFTHHLGHGVGLAPHEAPRLNPKWDDVFQVGDVFAAEPGLYGPDLRAGVRIENNYLVTRTGVECLSRATLAL